MLSHNEIDYCRQNNIGETSFTCYECVNCPVNADRDERCYAVWSYVTANDIIDGYSLEVMV